MRLVKPEDRHPERQGVAAGNSLATEARLHLESDRGLRRRYQEAIRSVLEESDATTGGEH